VEWLVLIVVALAIVAVVVFVAVYNPLVGHRLRCDGSWAQVAVELKRRHDLVPNLMEAVRGYMGFEQEVLTRVTQARAAAVAAVAPGPTSAGVENGLTGALRSLFAVMENYPELKANENVLSLQQQLADTEDRIATARDTYNAAVRGYNTAIATFPAVLLAGSIGFDRRPFFEAEPDAVRVPLADLGPADHRNSPDS
jgi:LemA protein